jgi:hypothetical protein
MKTDTNCDRVVRSLQFRAASALQIILNSIASKPTTPANGPTSLTAAAPVVEAALSEDSTPLLNLPKVDPEDAIKVGELLVVLCSSDTLEEADATSATRTLACLLHKKIKEHYKYRSPYL